MFECVADVFNTSKAELSLTSEAFFASVSGIVGELPSIVPGPGPGSPA